MNRPAFWVGVLGGVIASVLIGLFAVPALGLFNMSATGQPGFLDWWGNLNWNSSLMWRAPEATIPATANPAQGFEHFKSTCLECHGAPDAPRAEWAHRMQPMPPKLWEKETQQRSDGELFRIVSVGVRMTGMPAFGPEHSDADIWNIVAFIRQLDQLSEDQKQQLRQAARQGEHHHGEGGGHEHAENGHEAASKPEEQHNAGHQEEAPHQHQEGTP